MDAVGKGGEGMRCETKGVSKRWRDGGGKSSRREVRKRVQDKREWGEKKWKVVRQSERGRGGEMRKNEQCGGRGM